MLFRFPLGLFLRLLFPWGSFKREFEVGDEVWVVDDDGGDDVHDDAENKHEVVEHGFRKAFYKIQMPMDAMPVVTPEEVDASHYHADDSCKAE